MPRKRLPMTDPGVYLQEAESGEWMAGVLTISGSRYAKRGTSKQEAVSNLTLYLVRTIEEATTALGRLADELAEDLDGPSQEVALPSDMVLVPVQADGVLPGGTVSWEEQYKAWEAYVKQHPGQSAERIAERGGFTYAELVDWLGYYPKTWERK